VTDPETRREAIEALAAIQTEAARSALAAMARRRLWPWQRMERQLRAAAAAALRKPVTAADPDDE
jgi:HEAT repeat protein